MLKINKKMEYALIVLKHFQSQPGEDLLTARSICDLYNIPFDTTSKVMQVMNTHNILASIQGVKGGYRVAINLENINYLELSEIIEGKSIEHSCENNNCSIIDTCNITGPIQKLNEYLVYFFKTLSIKELLEESPGPKTIMQGLLFNENL